MRRLIEICDACVGCGGFREDLTICLEGFGGSFKGVCGMARVLRDGRDDAIKGVLDRLCGKGKVKKAERRSIAGWVVIVAKEMQNVTKCFSILSYSYRI